MKSRYLLAIPILISSLGANAEVTLDGSLGSSGALPGPDYLIGADFLVPKLCLGMPAPTLCVVRPHNITKPG